MKRFLLALVFRFTPYWAWRRMSYDRRSNAYMAWQAEWRLHRWLA